MQLSQTQNQFSTINLLGQEITNCRFLYRGRCGKAVLVISFKDVTFQFSLNSLINLPKRSCHQNVTRRVQRLNQKENHLELQEFTDVHHPKLTYSQHQWLHRASHQYREVTGSSPVEVLNFSGFFVCNCKNCDHNCEDHSSFEFTDYYINFIPFSTTVFYNKSTNKNTS